MASELGVAAALVRMSHLVQHVFADVSRDHGLPPQQLQVLCMLIAGPVGMTELGRQLHLERSSVTGLVDRVEKRRLVKRVSDPGDRRAYLVELTEDGRRLAYVGHGEVTARLESMTKELEHDDRVRLASVMTLILAEHGLS